MGGTNTFSPVKQCTDGTIVGRYGMVAIPLQILAGVSWFLYIVVSKLPSACGMIRVSRRGIEPSALVFSAVNCMPSSMELICVKNSFYGLIL